MVRGPSHSGLPCLQQLKHRIRGERAFQLDHGVEERRVAIGAVNRSGFHKLGNKKWRARLVNSEQTTHRFAQMRIAVPEIASQTDSKSHPKFKPSNRGGGLI